MIWTCGPCAFNDDHANCDKWQPHPFNALLHRSDVMRCACSCGSRLPVGALPTRWEDVRIGEGGDMFYIDLLELGLRVADAFEVEGRGDTGAIIWRAEEAMLEAMVRA